MHSVRTVQGTELKVRVNAVKAVQLVQLPAVKQLKQVL
jgi:hypothetical protein